MESKDPEGTQDDTSAAEKDRRTSLCLGKTVISQEMKQMETGSWLPGEHTFSRLWSLWVAFTLKIRVSRSEKDQMSFVSSVHSDSAGLCGQALSSPQPLGGTGWLWHSVWGRKAGWKGEWAGLR